MWPQLQDKLLEIDKKPISGIKLIGYNMLAIFSYSVVYAILIIIGAGDIGIFLGFCLIVAHFIFCVLMATTGKRSGVWPLSAVLVFILGFVTLTMIGLGLMGGV